MKKHFGSSIALCLFVAAGFASPNTTSAQESPNGTTQPPKVLVIQHEYLKPGRGGSLHQKSESAFVQAFTQANAPTHYIAANALSGKSRTLFFIGYDSFADWQKDFQTIMKNPTLAQAIDSAQEADGKLLTDYVTGVFVFQPDKSVSPAVNLGQMRYIESTILQVRLGHDEDWDALAKMHDSIFGKIPGAHWAMFEKEFGSDSGTEYIAVALFHSLAELDQHRAAAHQAWSSVSADQKKKMNDLEAATLESVSAELFAIDPKMSYPADKWKTADPDFWGQK